MQAILIHSSINKLKCFEQDFKIESDIPFFTPNTWAKGKHAVLINRDLFVLALPYGYSLKKKYLLREINDYYNEIYIFKDSKKDYYRDKIKVILKNIYESI